MQYKLDKGSVGQVSPNGTSQTCICGYPVPKDLSVRIHNCPRCGLVLGRDHVSAILIENRDIIGTDCTEFTPVEIEPNIASPVGEAGSPLRKRGEDVTKIF